VSIFPAQFYTSYFDPEVSNVSVSPTSEVETSAILLILSIENKKIWVYGVGANENHYNSSIGLRHIHTHT
jgi:hypothetical protein